MQTHIDPEKSLVIAAGLLGLIRIDGGPTDEQGAVLDALSQHLLGLEPKVLASLDPLPPTEVAASLGVTDAVRPFAQMAIILELCRHPRSETQLQKLEMYCNALGMEGPELEGVRTMAHENAKQATDDFLRVFEEYMPDLSEPQLLEASNNPDVSSERLWEQINRFDDLPAGTLGWGFVEFYRRNGLRRTTRETPAPSYYVAHDMNHVIAGYEPTGPGEIALGAFKLAMNNSEPNWMASMVNLLIHEVGLFRHGTSLQFVPYGKGGEPYHGLDGRRGAMTMPGAPELLAEAFVRGAATEADFSMVDHLSMADRPLADIRKEFHVIPLRQSMIEGEDPNYWPNI